MTRDEEYALEQERLQLADRDIADGERRVTEQRMRLLEITPNSPDFVLANHMLATLEANLAVWYGHRELILGRLHHLAALPESAAASAPHVAAKAAPCEDSNRPDQQKGRRPGAPRK